MNKRVQPHPSRAPAGLASRDPFALALARLREQRPIRKPRLRQIAADLQNNRIEAAERDLTEHLARHPDDADAISLMARVAVRLDRRSEAVSLLARCVELAPDFAAARFNHAEMLFKLSKFDAALAELDVLLKQDSTNPLVRQAKANILETIGQSEQSLAICEELAAENPGRAESWISYGHALRAMGFRDKSIAAYRKAIECRPSFGRAYWSLADLKSGCFDAADISAMEGQLKRADISQDDRIALQFSLARAYEDAAVYERSFSEYAKANAAARLRISYDPDKLSQRVADTKALLTPEFLASRDGMGCQAADPVFVLGRPRSGSTLIEQILSSHSAIEGTSELPYIEDSAKRLEAGGDYPRVLATLDAAVLEALGEEYLQRASVHRKLGRPFFIDKKPANFSHIGLILLILPNAKIIDARRNPAAACLSTFKQYRAKGSLRLTELGRDYRDYVEYMAHFDRVLPGRIHRVIYEDLVADPEAEVRRLIDYLGLPFEESCLRFYETKRTVLTPSSEQVRKPISSDAVDHWRRFEPWLGPLIKSLGSVFTEYPSVPTELRGHQA